MQSWQVLKDFDRCYFHWAWTEFQRPANLLVSLTRDIHLQTASPRAPRGGTAQITWLLWETFLHWSFSASRIFWTGHSEQVLVTAAQTRLERSIKLLSATLDHYCRTTQPCFLPTWDVCPLSQQSRSPHGSAFIGMWSSRRSPKQIDTVSGFRTRIQFSWHMRNIKPNILHQAFRAAVLGYYSCSWKWLFGPAITSSWSRMSWPVHQPDIPSGYGYSQANTKST